MEGLYLIKLREFIKCNENVYKIGKSIRLNKRIKSYPKNSKLELVYLCNNCNKAEQKILNIFDNEFIKRKDYGNEYYEGDVQIMINIIQNNIIGKKIDIINNIMVEPQKKNNNISFIDYKLYNNMLNGIVYKNKNNLKVHLNNNCIQNLNIRILIFVIYLMFLYSELNTYTIIIYIFF